MVQWIGTHLSMQGTWVGSLVWEDSTCHRSAKPVPTTKQLMHSWAPEPQLLKPAHSRGRAPQQEKPLQ